MNWNEILNKYNELKKVSLYFEELKKEATTTEEKELLDKVALIYMVGEWASCLNENM